MALSIHAGEQGPRHQTSLAIPAEIAPYAGCALPNVKIVENVDSRASELADPSAPPVIRLWQPGDSILKTILGDSPLAAEDAG